MTKILFKFISWSLDEMSEQFPFDCCNGFANVEYIPVRTDEFQ